MGTISSFVRSAKEIPSKYPAVIAGYIIYSYMFATIMRFFLTAKMSTVTYIDVIEMFDALPFMWLLAVTLVKVIEMRSKLHQSEMLRAEKEEELHMKETQMKTMQEVVMGLQHHINNPLAIVMLTINRIKRSAPESAEMISDITNAEESIKRITQTLKDFSESQNYEVEDVGPIIGTMAVPTERK